jgi:hypothetical protein
MQALYRIKLTVGVKREKPLNMIGDKDKYRYKMIPAKINRYKNFGNNFLNPKNCVHSHAPQSANKAVNLRNKRGDA